MLLVPLVPFGICSPCGAFWKSHPDFLVKYFLLVFFPCAKYLPGGNATVFSFLFSVGFLVGSPAISWPRPSGLNLVFCGFCSLLKFVP